MQTLACKNTYTPKQEDKHKDINIQTQGKAHKDSIELHYTILLQTCMCKSGERMSKCVQHDGKTVNEIRMERNQKR